MDTQQFLSLIWPTQGIYLLAVPRVYTDKAGVSTPYFQHHAFTDARSAAAWAATNGHEDVYFALASVQADYTRTTRDWRLKNDVAIRGLSKGTGKDNTRSVRAFWLDLDVGAEAHKYPSQEAAAHALVAFCRKARMPRPFITSSGGGLHVYWPLASDVDAGRWVEAALRLKAAAAKLGLLADPSRTADRASVLRPVGGWNHKTNPPRPVQLLMQGQVVQAERMLQHLLAMEAEHGLVVDVPVARSVAPALLGALPEHLRGLIGAGVDVNQLAADGIGFVEATAKEVVQRCQQLTWQFHHQDQVDEPLWYAMVGALYRAKGGEAGIHRMSCKHPGYSSAHTDAKIEQRKLAASGPTTCANFEALRPGGCDGCPVRGKVNTPLNIRREKEEAPAPKVEATAPDGSVAMRELPPPPKPFKRVVIPGVKVPEGQMQPARIAVTKKEDDGRVYDEVVYDYDVHPIDLVFDQRAGVYSVVIRTWLPMEGWREHTVALSVFADKRTTARAMAEIAVVVNPSKTTALVHYMSGYVRALQATVKAKVSYAQLGWFEGDDGWEFILPDAVVRAESINKLDVNRNFQNALEYKEPRGDLAVWKDVVAIFNRPQMVGHLFGFGVGFAAPLFSFTGFTGAMVSMVGGRGTGKTSAAKCANSVWGHIKVGWMDIEKDTWKAFYGKFGTLNNLPATFDEITNLDGERVSHLAYAVSKGTGRQRLEATGAAAANHGSWSTMLLATSNASLHARLAGVKADASAEATRIFEYRVQPGTLDKHEADANFIRLEDNFGVAGPVYAQQLVRRREWARNRVHEWIKAVDKLAGTGSSERFWSAVVATIATGFELANECGLTSVDVNSVVAFGVKQIKVMTENVVSDISGPEDLLAAYINGSLRTTLVVNSDYTRNQMATIVSSPTGDELRARIEMHKGLLFIDRAAWNKFCADKNADSKDAIRQLRESGVCQPGVQRIMLSRGTRLQGAQVHCYIFNIDNPKLSGVAQAVVGEQQEQVV